MKVLKNSILLAITLVSSCFFVGEGFAEDAPPPKDTEFGDLQWAMDRQEWLGSRNGSDVASDNSAAAREAWANSTSWGAGGSVSSPLASPGFTFDPNSISPSSKRYTLGSSESSGNGNTITILKRIINILLVVVSTGAVLFTIVGGFFMATSAGDTEKANRGKTIITYNIIAVAIAMLSYGIMQFVIWLIGVPS